MKLKDIKIKIELELEAIMSKRLDRLMKRKLFLGGALRMFRFRRQLKLINRALELLK